MMRLALAAAASLLAAGCATIDVQPSLHRDSARPELRECAQWYEEMDARIDAAGVRDAQDARVSGFPYLRASRLLASFLLPSSREEAGADPKRFSGLLERMQALDLAARRVEFANLGAGDAARAERCAGVLRAVDEADPAARRAIAANAVVPDDYSDASRALGLYALTRYPFSNGVRRHLEEVRASFSRDLALAPGVRLERHSPPPAVLPRAEAAAILARSSANALRIPEPSGRDLERLFAAHAPVFDVEVSGDYDRVGTLRWEQGAAAPTVDTSRPVVYRNLAWTRYRGETLLQLVYTIWFTERPANSALDILAGKLDGLTWRVTLAPDGEPLVYDTIHPCGCYHMFFPTARARATPAPEGEVEWMFAPQEAPSLADDERMVLRVATRSHYLERLATARLAPGSGPGAAGYAFREYDELRSLPRPEGGRASLFGPDGLVAASERPERMLFWPMGIPSAGAMRQWGRHSTAFVGRRHFDDADLLEKRFELRLR